MNIRIRNMILSLIIFEFVIITLLLTINVSKLKKENEKIKENLRKIEVKSKLYYEDILQILEK